MGTFSLICHPKTPALGVSAVSVDWAAQATGLVLTYRVAGAGRLILPAPPVPTPPVPTSAAPERADGLWKTTCFELFLGLAGQAYREYNFSPSTRWATYAFTAYREGGQNAEISAPPIIAIMREADIAQCRVILPHDALAGATQAGLTAVIAEEGGHLSYWALAHAAAKPDFHQRACFTLAIAAAEAP